jgi:ATP-dependent Clp protease protease subunit
MIHQPLGGVEGQATGIEIHTKEILRIREILNKILSTTTEQTMEKIGKDTDRNYFMSAEEAKKYGILDDVIKQASALVKKGKSK